MKSMNQIKMEAIVDSHRKKLMHGAMIIQIISMLVLVTSLVELIVDPVHWEAYCVVFVFFGLTGLFGILQYDKHKREFK